MFQKMVRVLVEVVNGLKRSLEISDKHTAVRRYFFSNSFDGVLAVMGLSLGAAIVPGTDVSTIVFAGVGAATAMLVSGVSGIFLTERAETHRMIREIEESMLRDVSDTVIGKAGSVATLVVSLVGGLSTFLLSMTVLLPYIVSMQVVDVRPMAPMLSTLTGLCILFILGMFLGRFSRINVLKTGLQMMGLGVVTSLLIMLIERLVG